MISVKKILAAVAALFASAFAVTLAVLSGKRRELKAEKEKNALLSAQTEAEKQQIVESANAREKNREKQESFNTGNADADFANTIGFLHECAKNAGKH